MKILFIASNSFDYSQDIAFSGLLKVLGSASLTHWRPNPKFIASLKRYPKNMGWHPRGWRTASIFTPNPKNYDAVILGACKPDAFASYISLANTIPSNVPVIFIDGGDWEEIGGDLTRIGKPELLTEAELIRDFDWVFKREHITGKKYGPNVKPFPFGFNLSCIPVLPNKKKYDVTFWATRSHPIRAQVLQKIENEFDCSENGTTVNQMSKKFKRRGNFYLQELASGKVSLNFRGSGWDTLRYWEVPAVGGFMISQRPGIDIPNNFKHEKHVVFCQDDLSDLTELCSYFLKNETLRERIALAGRNHLHTFHTDIERAKTILSVISQ